MRKGISLATIAAALWLVTYPAFAHHALGGQAPITFSTGFLSGLAHPVINLDHFAFVIAVGVLTAVAQGSLLLPIWFVGGTVAGCIAAAYGYSVPFTYSFVAASVAVVGALLAIARPRLGPTGIALFVGAGILHGSAYADSIIGTGINSLFGYLLGFAIVQAAVAVAAAWAAYALWCGDRLYANARIVGGVVAGVGLTVLVQTGVAAVFPAI